jgi:hypothetical protein
MISSLKTCPRKQQHGAHGSNPLCPLTLRRRFRETPYSKGEGMALILRRSLAEKLNYYDFGKTKLLLRLYLEVAKGLRY